MRLKVSIDLSGMDAGLTPKFLNIWINEYHPLVRLAGALPWPLLMQLVAEDLKKTTAKGCWWMGPKLFVRVHLGAYMLQKLYNLTDRATEYGIKDNAAYQLFCGVGVIKNWHAPDHTKIEEFRSRLSAETQRNIANTLAKVSVQFGYGDPSETDFDSTVQEANIAYPSDASLMSKLCGMGRKFIDYLKKHTRNPLLYNVSVDMKTVKEYARSYFFLSKNVAIEKRRAVFLDLLTIVKQQMRPVVDICNALDSARIARLPWNIRRAYDQIKTQAWRYLLDVGHFTRTHSIKAGKILSLHASAVACIKKGKVGKDKEFGRVFQLARIKGNFMFVLESTSIRMNDKLSLVPLLNEHQALFGEGILKSMSTDKGYWSSKNVKAAGKLKVRDIGIQATSNIKNTRHLPTKEIQEKLRDRRAGIEPLIGHAKHGGQLGKSRMKSDAATLAAGYGSVLGFNLRQMIRHQGGKIKKAA
jgi:transposase, IS5 family